jgi:hypothetical protein
VRGERLCRLEEFADDAYHHRILVSSAICDVKSPIIVEGHTLICEVLTHTIKAFAQPGKPCSGKQRAAAIITTALSTIARACIT